MSTRLKKLNTARTEITEYTSQDLPLLAKLEHDPEVMHFFDGPVTDEDKNREKLQGFIDYYQEQPGYGSWKACLKDGSYIGSAALNRPCLSSNGLRQGPVQVGYILDKIYWGQGYATEMARRLLGYAFDTLQLESVIAITSEDHRGSRRVMEKIGMSPQGLTTEFYNHELIWYQIEHQQWLDFTISNPMIGYISSTDGRRNSAQEQENE